MTAEQNKFDLDESLLDPKYYGEHGYPYEAWRKLRRDDPVHFVDEWLGDPYWAITRYQDIVEISKNPDLFKNAPRFFMAPQKGNPKPPSRGILDMDPPEHRTYRSIVSRRFTPRALEKFGVRIQHVCDKVIDAACADGATSEIDFVDRISARIPIWVIAEMFGAPLEDWEKLYQWTNESVGADDPEYQKGRSSEETRAQGIHAMNEYFSHMVIDRRKKPKDDLATDIALAKVDGESLPELELMSYYNILMSAGNETTRNATTGGLMLLLEHPEELERLRQDSSHMDGFIEELLRMVSPVIHMVRTPLEDIEFGGKTIKAHTPMVLFYPSANRDEIVFDNADKFRIDRDPNHHLAFGIGEHFCLGTHVAKLELKGIFERLLNRMEHIELAGDASRLHNNVVGGIKRLPVRYRLRM